jgi:hypothetical protein
MPLHRFSDTFFSLTRRVARVECGAGPSTRDTAGTEGVIEGFTALLVAVSRGLFAARIASAIGEYRARLNDVRHGVVMRILGARRGMRRDGMEKTPP